MRCRNDELNTRLKFDVEHLNRQIERQNSRRSNTDGAESVCPQVLMNYLTVFMQSLLEDGIFVFLILKFPELMQQTGSLLILMCILLCAVIVYFA